MSRCAKCKAVKPVCVLFKLVVAGGECDHELCDLCLYGYGHELFMDMVKYHCSKKARGQPQYPERRCCPVKGCGANWEAFLCNSINVPFVSNRCGSAWDGYILRCIPAAFIELPICKYADELESLRYVKTQPLLKQLKLVYKKWTR